MSKLVNKSDYDIKYNLLFTIGIKNISINTTIIMKNQAKGIDFTEIDNLNLIVRNGDIYNFFGLVIKHNKIDW